MKHHHALKPIYVCMLIALTAQSAAANPLGPSVANGQVGFATTGSTLTVTNTPGAIINWQGFSIAANEVTRFAQQSAASAVLNRVVSSNPSSILGALQSNGQVFLVNPNGIMFGAGSTVDVAGLVATTLNLSDADFLAGRNNFTQVPGAQNISNAGNITAQTGGQIFLIAPNVENTGVITAPNGEILLAAGHSVELVNSNDPSLRVNITAPAGDATNVGQLIASSGNLGLFGTVVRNSGTVSADSAVQQGGRIVFKASQRAEAGGSITASGTSGGSVTLSAAHSSDPNAPGVVIQTGSIQAQGTAGTGGTVSMNADSILSTAAIKVDGTTAGGLINVQAAGRALSTSSAQYTANSSQGQGGDILVSANVSNYTSGSYGATGVTGGNLTLAGNEIKLAGAQLDASGTNGGGAIHVGGLMHGAAGFSAQGIALGNAASVFTNSSASFNADALQSGNGGEVVLWSDQAMSFKGGISAKGGALSGNGGMAEVSGLTSLGYSGLTNLSAANGVNGTLLLDPRNITIVAGNGALAGTPYQEIFDPTPSAGEGFGGWQNLVLGNGNILIASPLDSAFGLNSGAVYLFNPTGSLVTALVGSAAGDKVGAVTNSGFDYSGLMQLTNGNVLVKSNNWSNTFGAVTWMNQSGQLADGSTGGAVSAANSLVGGTAGSSVNQLANSNVLVMTSTWNNAGNANAGAVTWMDGANGKLSDGTSGGAISTANSLIGGVAGDQVGSDGITLVTDYSTYWNYAVRSSLWGSGGIAANALGAVTWINGATGKLSNAASGDVLSSANSLVGSTAGDKVGTMTFSYNYGYNYTSDSSGMHVGGNGNLIVTSNNWNNGGVAARAGAITWMNGGTGELFNSTVQTPVYGGVVSDLNSLVGSAADDRIGTITTIPWAGATAESSGLVWLSSGNFLVRSTQWGSAGVAANALGAVTWGSGTSGVSGIVSSANSIVGSALGDRVGVGIIDPWTADPGLVILPNGNYVVVSSQWGGGKGAVTWGNGNSGTSGAVAGIAGTGNALSLVGVGPGYDGVGAQGIAVQNGGSNYVVKSPWFDSGGLPDSGAITWMNGTTGALSDGLFGGAVSSANSLLGGFAYDNVGEVTALNNGNFLAITPVWGGYPSTPKGAVTWINGVTGQLANLANGGVISSTNSLLGSTANDMSGLTVIQLANDNILLKNSNWDSGANQDVGALTWMNGFTGELSNSTVGTPVYGGVIGTANSLVGAYGGVYTYSPYWPYYYYAGREKIGDAGVTELSSGNVVVQTYTWHNPTTNADNAGAVTWMDGATGMLVDGSTGGTISDLNSLVGDVANSSVGNYTLTQLGNGNVVIRSPQWNSSAGAVTWMDGATGALADGSSWGVISAANSLIGSTANDSVGSGGVTEVTDYANFWNYVVRSSAWDNGTIVDAGAITWVDGATGSTSDGLGVISTANSLVGSSANDQIGFNYWNANGVLALSNGNIVFANSAWNGGMGAVTWMEGATGVLADGSSGGAVLATNSLVGSTANDNIGMFGMTEITDYSTFSNYVIQSPDWTNGAAASAGAVTFGDGLTGTVGVVSGSNSLVGNAANDRVGSGGITVVTDYSTFWNYLVHSPDWGGAGGYQAGKGAVTWVNGQTGQLTTGTVGGVVGSSTSLIGSSLGDQVGVAPANYYNGLSGVNVLGNGNLLIRSQHWGGEFSALTWMNGATGALAGGATGGVVSASNSLLGSAMYDDLGSGEAGLTELQVNRNWVITSPGWGGAGATNGKGAVTWMNSSTGQLADGSYGGVVSASNSLVGSDKGDTVGGDYYCDCSYPPGGITALSDGNYVVNSPDWGYRGYPANIPATGAVSWGSGTSGLVGLVSSSNSLLGVFDAVTELGQSGKVLVGNGAANGGKGGVYLLGQQTGLGPLFADLPSSDATIGAGWIASTLNLGTNVVLQANNDITQLTGAAINATTGIGNLTLQAGRSVLLNDTINIAGALSITANDAVANLAYRSAGAAQLQAGNLLANSVSLVNTGGSVVGAVTANALNVIAAGGINLNTSVGVLTTSNTGVGNTLINNIGVLSVSGMTDTLGSVTLNTSSDVNVNGGISAGSFATVSARDVNVNANGYINTSSGALTVTGSRNVNLVGGGYINSYNGPISVTATSGNVNINTFGYINSYDGFISLRASSGDINVNTGGYINTRNGVLDILAGNNVNLLNSGYINSLDGAINVGAGGDVSLATNGHLTSSNGAIDVTAGGDVSLAANGYVSSWSGGVSIAGGNLNLQDSDINSGVSTTLRVGNDLILNNGSIWGGQLNGSVGRDVSITGGTNWVSGLFGSPDIGSASSPFSVGGVIRMNDDLTGLHGAQMHAGMPYSIWIHFPNRYGGGYFVNGIDGAVSNGVSGFYANGIPAVLDSNLHIIYGLNEPPLITQSTIFSLTNLPTNNLSSGMPLVAMSAVDLMFKLNPSAAGTSGTNEDNKDNNTVLPTVIPTVETSPGDNALPLPVCRG